MINCEAQRALTDSIVENWGKKQIRKWTIASEVLFAYQKSLMRNSELIINSGRATKPSKRSINQSMKNGKKNSRHHELKRVQKSGATALFQSTMNDFEPVSAEMENFYYQLNRVLYIYDNIDEMLCDQVLLASAENAGSSLESLKNIIKTEMPKIRRKAKSNVLLLHANDPSGKNLSHSIFDSLMEGRLVDENSPLSEFIALLEDIFCVVVGLTHCDNNISAIVLISFFVKTRLKQRSIVCDIMRFVNECLSNDSNENELESHAGFATDTYNKVKSLSWHPVFRNGTILASLCVTAGIVKPTEFSLGGLKMFHLKACEIAKNPLDTLDSVVESIAFFFDVGWKCFTAGSMEPVISASDERTALAADVVWLTSHFEEIKQGNYKQNTNEDPILYAERLRNAITSADLLYKQAIKPADKSYLFQTQITLSKLQASYQLTQAASKQRIQPYCIKLYGKSSVGKTSLNHFLMKQILHYNGFLESDEYCVTLNTHDKYMSNLRSDTTCIILDDLCNTNPDKSTVDPASLIISLVNNSFSYAIMAEAHDKGKIVIQPKLVCITTNSRDLTAPIFSVEPVSILRRIMVHFDVKMKPDFATNGKLDSVKVLEKYDPASYAITDIWLISAYTIRPKKGPVVDGPEGYTYVPIVFEGKSLIDTDIFTILRFVAFDSKKHYEMQDRIIRHSSSWETKATWCDCGLLAGACGCHNDLETQGGFGLEAYLGRKMYDLAITSARKQIGSLMSYTYESVMDAIWPTRMERWVINALANTTRGLVHHDIISSPFSWIDFVPLGYIDNTWFDIFYRWVERKKIVRRALRFASIICMPIHSYSGILLYRTFKSKCSLEMLLVTATCGCAFHALVAVHSFSYYKRKSFEILAQKRTYAQQVRVLSNSRTLEAQAHRGWEKVVNSVVLAGAAFAGYEITKFVYNVYKNYKMDNVHTHSSLNPVSADELDNRDKTRNPWMCPLGSFPWIGGKKNKGQSIHLINRIKKNLLYVRNNDTDLGCCGLMVKSNLMILPYHILFENCLITEDVPERTPITCIRADVNNTGSSFKEVLSFASYVRLPNLDCILVYICAGGTFSDLTHYFTDFVYTGDVSTIQRLKTGAFQERNGVASSAHIPYSQRYPCTFNGLLVKSTLNWMPGDCFSVHVCNSSLPKIVGLHVLGYKKSTLGTYSNEGYSVIITCTMLQQAIALLEGISGKLVCHAETQPLTRVGPYTAELVETIHPNCPINFIQDRNNCNISVLGTISGSVTYKSRVRDSKLLSALIPFFGPQRWGKPRFAPDGHKWKPWYDTMIHLSKPRFGLDTRLLDLAFDDYCSTMISRFLIFLAIEDVRPLTDNENLCGRNGKRFIDALNLNSAMGFPVPGIKREHVNEFISEDTLQRSLEWKYHDYFEDVSIAEDKYAQGMRAGFIFKACLKDEPTKLTSEKVRVFQAAPIVLQLLTRKYFLPIARFMSIYPLVSECAVGINPLSREWQELHSHVTTYGGEHIVAGDYSKWDLRLPAQLTLRAFSVFIVLAKQSAYYTDRDILIMKGIASDICYPLINYNGTLLQCFGSNPSGQNLTAYVNSICNSLLQRMFYYSLNPTHKFIDAVKTITYGDDFMSGVDVTKTDFNHVKYRNWLMDECDMTLTMPDKTSAPLEFLTIYHVDFLKRKSFYHIDIGYRIGKLDLDSILKSLYTVTCDKRDENNVISSIIGSAMHELFFHGREVYDEFARKLNVVVSEVGLVVPALTISYDEKLEKIRLDETEL